MLLQHGLSSEPPDHSFALKRHCGVAISGLSGVFGASGRQPGSCDTCSARPKYDYDHLRPFGRE